MKDREHNDQKFENTKVVIRRHKSMKDREHNGQKFEGVRHLSQLFSDNLAVVIDFLILQDEQNICTLSLNVKLIFTRCETG